jgi:beta-galactosidase
MVKGDTAERIEALVRDGGTFVTTVMSGRVDEDDNAFLSDVPGPFAGLLGIRIDETDSLPEDVANPVVLSLPGATDLPSAGSLVFDIIQPEGAEAVGTYGAEFYAGTPAVTRNPVGAGEAWYVGTPRPGAPRAGVRRAAL